MNVTTQTLREQHRQRTGAAIHDVTYRLVKEHGIAATSIDDIAKAAGISRRTFFNYYTAKETALYGFLIPNLPEESVSAFYESTDPLLLRCVRLVLSAYTTSQATSSTLERRRELIRTYPETHVKLEGYMNELEQLVEPIVLQLEGVSEVSVSLILHTAGAIIRYCTRANLPLDETTLSHVIETLHEITRKDLRE